MLVVRVGRQPGDDGLGASDAAGSHAGRAHVGGVSPDNHGAGSVAGRAASHGHRPNTDTVRL